MKVHPSYHKLLDEMGAELRLGSGRPNAFGATTWIGIGLVVSLAVIAAYLLSSGTSEIASSKRREELSELKGELESIKLVVRGLVGTVKELAPTSEAGRGQEVVANVRDAEKAERVIATIISNSELRTTPKSDSKAIGKVPKNSVLIVVQDSGSWVQVFGPLGVPGWIEKSAVKLSKRGQL